jgi:glycogen(starch) synthase
VGKPRVLLVGRTRYRLPLDPSLRLKFDALRDRFDLRVLGSAPDGGPPGDETFRLVPPLRPRKLDGLAFHLSLPFRIARELRRFGPDVVLVQGAHEAAAALAARTLARRRVPVIADVHGDWKTATRLYGSPARRLLSPLADTVGDAAVRRADAVRTVSDYTTGLVRAAGVEPAGTFPAFMDLQPFLERPPEPLPERQVALFVGVLELYKNVDGLADAWRLAAPRLRAAELRIVGRGTRTDVVEALLRDFPEQTVWLQRLTTAEVADELDRARVLVLPSRSEGMGRVIVEAFCRGRPVVATRVGGIVDLVQDGVNGLLVEPGDTAELTDAIVRILTDRELSERLAGAARPSVEPWLATPEEYADRLHALVASLA